MSVQNFLKRWLADYYKPPRPHRFALSLPGVVLEAWRLCKGQRWRFWTANYAVVFLGLVPVIAPIFAVQFPQLMFVKMMPVIPLPIAMVLTKVMPVFYFLFFTIPLHLGLFLIAAHIVYQKPYQITTTLLHYFKLFWLSNLFKVILAIGFFIGSPTLFVLSKLLLVSFKGQAIASMVVLYSFAVLLSMFSLYAFFSCLLLFIGRVTLLTGLKVVVRMVSQHFWKLWLLFLLQLLISLASQLSWHVLDLLWTPFSYVLWLVIYKKMFGNQCHEFNECD